MLNSLKRSGLGLPYKQVGNWSQFSDLMNPLVLTPALSMYQTPPHCPSSSPAVENVTAPQSSQDWLHLPYMEGERSHSIPVSGIGSQSKSRDNNGTLSILYFNARSLVLKLNELSAVIEAHNPDIVSKGHFSDIVNIN